MKGLWVVLVIAAALTLRFGIWKYRQRRPAAGEPAAGVRRPERMRGLETSLGDVGLVATREIRERVRGRIFRVGTLIILLIVGAAIVIPSIHRSSGPTEQTVGVVGSLPASTVELVHTAATRNGDTVRVVSEPSVAAADTGLRSGALDLVVVDGSSVVLDLPASDSKSPADPGLVTDVADYLGIVAAYRVAGLTPAQAAAVDRSQPVPVRTLQAGRSSGAKGSSVIGLVVLFLMLNQYNTWILIGVMQEKASRVVEVLLATLRPLQLLGGKVLGIGLVALGQATLIVGFALALSAAVGSDALKGTGPLVLLSELLWLVLGYTFYCWVYAAAGSMAERQDQVQTLALPLSIPIVVAYIFSITVASSGSVSVPFEVLAYLPPTAPFCMTVLVALDRVAWWQFTASVVITMASTVGMAVLAARIYQRAVLRTGGRVHLRQLLRGGAR